MSKRYALIVDGVVESVIIWNDEVGNIEEHTPHHAVNSDVAEIGDLYIDGNFIKPEIEQ
jgi:hypothetical protein